MKKLLLGLLFAVTSLSIFASDEKMGVVDMGAVRSKTPAIEQMQKSLQQQFASREQQIQQAQQQMQQDLAKLNRDASVMSASDKDALTKKAQAEQQNIRTMVGALQKDYYSKQNELLQKVIAKMQIAVSKVAKEKGLSIVLPKEAILYATNYTDITQDVISEMGK